MKRLILIIDDVVHTFDPDPNKGFIGNLTVWNNKGNPDIHESDPNKKYISLALQLDCLPPNTMPYAEWQKPC